MFHFNFSLTLKVCSLLSMSIKKVIYYVLKYSQKIILTLATAQTIAFKYSPDYYLNCYNSYFLVILIYSAKITYSIMYVPLYHRVLYLQVYTRDETAETTVRNFSFSFIIPATGNLFLSTFTLIIKKRLYLTQKLKSSLQSLFLWETLYNFNLYPDNQ